MIPDNVSELIDSSHHLRANGESVTMRRNLLIAVRRHIHKNPEIGLHEFETSRFIREVLQKQGLEVHGPVAGTGLYVDIHGDEPGPMIAYRADIDALPIQDTKKVAYASHNPGVAHLCGHDAHTAVAIGIALALNDRKSDIKGAVRVFFQPNEEGVPSGAPLMIQGGILNGVSAAYAIHVDPALPLGTFGLRTGPATAASDGFNVTILGERTGHSARPHLVVDTIWIANQILNTLYSMVGRVNDTRNSAILTVCRIHAGEANNVIPAEIKFGGTLRCTDQKDREKLRELLRHTSLRIADLHNARAQVEFNQGAPPVVNDGRLHKHIEKHVRLRFGESAVHEIIRPSMGAEDFAHYLDYVPGFLVRVGTHNSHHSTAYPLHDSNFDIDEHAIEHAVSLMSDVLVDHLKERPLK